MMMYTINEFVVIYLCKMLFVSAIKRCNFNRFGFFDILVNKWDTYKG